ncbi:PREDICTED: thrombospondin type-1 domain-containing protein 4-like [Eufriesea mexicana]|uniref:thrombospondin type-1 domain-containing protein 4-like n=1 Tax=Eufriesea mexicana TaxID=516756 RepID=UPI00083C11AC|nr:PREDICTED: thrombospondin type-1 domain-containing protein 4-like [Eufriesea mexicana]XP_017764299.1 PREDICTED: thrombospondin type-1 domain-containing protein 4-like [Eufriesea mexicana]XP_017764300.1 PREDICTED: thrombospondin type-1 domain-containing protein 4-like [Eufriesea mexicana]XP_017764301.1 PREDICTED: thrombospondin type-1 domain-containing protein 4-like [Eufriesea mexicana]XP_017764302.1 PREDICTED: thrombospondin type-1 domain-containing protein 4-like [Eufriesea mexicana]XP_01
MFSKMDQALLFSVVISLTCFSSFCDGHLIDGIFTEPTLERGYNLVATVPRGALALNVTQLRHTENYLAVKLQDGSYLFNGNYSISLSGKYQAAGSTFVYLRQSSQNLESFSAVGPLQEPIDVMVLYQEPNPGIVYRYIIPGSVGVSPNSHVGHKTVSNKAGEPILQTIPHRKIEPGPPLGDGTQTYLPRRYKKRKFFWKASGYTECSRTCGGGFQMLRYICIREHTQTPVPDKRCHTLEKPRETQIRCNTTPCPPKWRAGPWGDCSVTCGSGTRVRELECVQEITPSLIMRISDGACMEPKILPTSEACEMPRCEFDAKVASTTLQPPQWSVGSWSTCSATCGPGQRTRAATCVTQGPPCDLEVKPITQDACDLGPCTTKSPQTNAISTSLESAQWLFTEWSEDCSAECGVGMQTRKVFCEKGSEEEFCDQSTRPETSRTCSSNRTCSGQWFTGPWTACSTECDAGEQVREVVCITTLRGTLRVVLDMNCPANKPETRRSCSGPPCASMWFISDWAECSRSCGKGIQKREVRCLNREGQSPEHHELHCKEKDRPMSRRTCNDYPCKDDMHRSENHHTVLQVQNDPEISNVLEENPLCKDSISNCNLVAQARLCTYQFYQQLCCQSCSRAKQDLE